MLIIPTIVNIVSVSEDLCVLELWALPSGLGETRERDLASEMNQTKVNFTGAETGSRPTLHN